MEKNKEFLDELGDAALEYAEKTMRIADKYGLSRDDLMKEAATRFFLTTRAMSFEECVLEEEGAENE